MFPRPEQIITSQTTIFWFRRDLRLLDNTALYFALKEQQEVLPLFIFDTEILNSLTDKADKRVDFIHQTLEALKAELEKLGSTLLVWRGTPTGFFSSITPKAVYCNHDYEPYGRERDARVKAMIQAKNGFFCSYKDQVIFEKSEVTKADGTPYTVFTPYSKKWIAALASNHYKPYKSQDCFGSFKRMSPLPMLSLQSLGFQKTDAHLPERVIKISTIEKYHLTRNFPGVAGTSGLSIHLRFGTVSVRKLVGLALSKNQVWLNELIWREFYQMILWHFPRVHHSFKARYDRIEWRNNQTEFSDWKEGRTGYPLVDAAMRELNTTGFMHNRARMIAASFLTKHLLIDWRWGEAYFAQKLLDFDLAANNGGWQWAAGCGCDAAPYFRVFNPTLQTQKFDPELTYIKKWVPDFGAAGYPKPIVNHEIARKRAIETYKRALQPT